MLKYTVITAILALLVSYIIIDIHYMSKKLKVVIGDSYSTVCSKLSFTDENIGHMDDTYNGVSTYIGYKNNYWWHPFKVSFRIYFSNTGSDRTKEHVIKIIRFIDLKWLPQ